jgi:hypothetical protein
MFEQFQTDKIKIIKKDSGAVSPEIKAMVDSKNCLIHIHTRNITEGWDINDGDYIDRILPDNRLDRYIVLDNGFKTSWQVFPERYECVVKKTTSIDIFQATSVVYNLNGHNTRVYNDSIDNSKNIININNSELFDSLIRTIKDQVSDNSELINFVREMEKNQGKSGFVKSYQDFISSAANHMTILAPYLPALTQLLT